VSAVPGHGAPNEVAASRTDILIGGAIHHSRDRIAASASADTVAPSDALPEATRLLACLDRIRHCER